jgi:arginyl-tRNA synthetase
MSMRVLLEDVKKNLAQIMNGMGLSKVEFVLEPAKEGFGDVTCNVAFLVAKQLGKNHMILPNRLLNNTINSLAIWSQRWRRIHQGI